MIMLKEPVKWHANSRFFISKTVYSPTGPWQVFNQPRLSRLLPTLDTVIWYRNKLWLLLSYHEVKVFNSHYNRGWMGTTYYMAVDLRAKREPEVKRPPSPRLGTWWLHDEARHVICGVVVEHEVGNSIQSSGGLTLNKRHQ